MKPVHEAAFQTFLLSLQGRTITQIEKRLRPVFEKVEQVREQLDELGPAFTNVEILDEILKGEINVER